MTYKELLRTKEWKYYRLYVATVKNFTCELCGDIFYRGYHIHHKHYIDGLMPWQYSIKDVMFLCAQHHYKVHRPEIEDKINKAIKRNNPHYK
jgi:5-methylcytosine-specific restriction endonuclease McrA